MSYLTSDTSIDSGQPVELYVFRQNLQVWYYTSGPDTVLWQGVEYVPATIVRSTISQSNDNSGSGITLTFPRSHEFATQFLGFSPDLVTTLTIYRGHLTDQAGEYVAYWKGRVMLGKATGHELSLECESVFTSLSRTGLRARYQLTCRHTLYSPGCGVNMDSYKVQSLVQASSSNSITCSAAGSYPDGWFAGGMVRLPSGAMRFITGHTGALLGLSRPFQEEVGNLTVDLFPGCDHLKSTCIAKFNNLLNYGGFPYIPTTNPFGGSSII